MMEPSLRAAQSSLRAALSNPQLQYPAAPGAAARCMDAAAAALESCAGCGCVISERYLLRAVDRYWHEDCLKCSCCDCRLGEVGATLFTRANLLLCRRDYLRSAGHCTVGHRLR